MSPVIVGVTLSPLIDATSFISSQHQSWRRVAGRRSGCLQSTCGSSAGDGCGGIGISNSNGGHQAWTKVSFFHFLSFLVCE